MPVKFPLVTTDLRESFARSRCVVIPDVLPPTLVESWRSKAERTAATLSRIIERAEGGHVLSYRVVTGDTIQQAWPELWSFYTAPEALEWVAEIAAEPRVYTSTHVQSAVNLNVLDKPGDVYRWHYDAVPYTLILFLTDTDPDSGGLLEIWPNGPPAGEAKAHKPPECEVLQVIAPAGAAVLMDGSLCYHRVTQLRRPHMRLTIPMVYPTTNDDDRPAGLDRYLYEPSRGR